jgi:iron only hydrogenase large subunit-like protein
VIPQLSHLNSPSKMGSSLINSLKDSVGDSSTVAVGICTAETGEADIVLAVGELVDLLRFASIDAEN